jgi:flagellar protein FlaG
MDAFISMAGDAEGSKGIELLDTRLTFTIDEDTGETVISIIDSETGEVIKKIPPDEILSLKKRIGEMIGLLLDEKA